MAVKKVTLAYHLEVTHGVVWTILWSHEGKLKEIHNNIHNAHLKEHKILKKGG